MQLDTTVSWTPPPLLFVTCEFNFTVIYFVCIFEPPHTKKKKNPTKIPTIKTKQNKKSSNVVAALSQSTNSTLYEVPKVSIIKRCFAIKHVAISNALLLCLPPSVYSVLSRVMLLFLYLLNERVLENKFLALGELKPTVCQSDNQHSYECLQINYVHGLTIICLTYTSTFVRVYSIAIRTQQSSEHQTVHGLSTEWSPWKHSLF